jgi:predicted nucleotidyltransferase
VLLAKFFGRPQPMLEALNALAEAVIDPTREGLDPAVFDCPNGLDRGCRMKAEIRRQILDQVENITAAIGQEAQAVYVKGSILSRQWLDRSDIDVLLELDAEISDGEYARIKEHLKERYDSRVLAVGTEHPLQFYASHGPFDASKADGLYDLRREEWHLGPYDLHVDVVGRYLHDFEAAVSQIDLTKSELERDLIDYEIFRELADEDVADVEQHLLQKIDEIDDGVEELIALFQRTSDLRDHAFEKELTPQEIREYGSKNALPANVVYKLLERYHYVNLMKQLKRLRKKQGPVDSPKDVEQVKQIVAAN